MCYILLQGAKAESIVNAQLVGPLAGWPPSHHLQMRPNAGIVPRAAIGLVPLHCSAAQSGAAVVETRRCICILPNSEAGADGGTTHRPWPAAQRFPSTAPIAPIMGGGGRGTDQLGHSSGASSSPLTLFLVLCEWEGAIIIVEILGMSRWMDV